MTTTLLLTLVQNIGLSLAIGASTFALIFHFKSLEDGIVDPSEKRFMHTVRFVLHIGMALIVFSEFALAGWFWWQGDLFILYDETFWFRWTVLGVIILNMVVMTLQRMPRSLGPAIAGGSWYMYLIASTLAVLSPPYVLWLVFYVLFVGAFAVFLKIVRTTYLEHDRPA